MEFLNLLSILYKLIFELLLNAWRITEANTFIATVTSFGWFLYSNVCNCQKFDSWLESSLVFLLYILMKDWLLFLFRVSCIFFFWLDIFYQIWLSVRSVLHKVLIDLFQSSVFQMFSVFFLIKSWVCLNYLWWSLIMAFRFNLSFTGNSSFSKMV